MKSNIVVVVVLSLIGGMATLHAEDGNIRTEANPEAQAEISVEDFTWLIGHWQGEAGGSTMDEFWTPPAAGTMQCIFRMYNPEGQGFYQFILLGEQEGRFMMRLKHFSTELKGIEEKDQTIDYVFLDRGPSTFYFENLTFEQNSDTEFTVHVRSGQGESAPVVTLKYFKVE